MRFHTFSGTLTGTFTDDSTATATSAIDGVCEGDACDGVLALLNEQNGTDVSVPCSSSIAFEMTASADAE